MRQRWTITIPDYWPPTPNQLGEGRGKGRHFALRTHKQRAADYVSVFINHADVRVKEGGVWQHARYDDLPPMPRFVGKVKLTIIREWGKRQRELDPDNLEASCKFLIDVLRRQRANEKRRRLGIIEDDRPDNFWRKRPIIQQRKSPDEGKRCIIIIEGAVER